MLFVLKLKIKILSPDILRDFPCSKSGLWLKTCCCVCTYYRSKTVKSRIFFVLHVCGLSHFEDKIVRFKKYFSVYAAVVHNFVSVYGLR